MAVTRCDYRLLRGSGMLIQELLFLDWRVVAFTVNGTGQCPFSGDQSRQPLQFSSKRI
jgi:hypothetical protein